ncbi:formylmethanofuran dehydrogenase subunit E family protein [Candidatus Sumerlaeota bacterium]|nr:formylmethanofuran dehydrogenase subunit E family protein [Candidatus Sumerlaeota bacterium]
MRSTPGQSEWNLGREPEDWWREVLRYHGHVGPWNVIGWRIGKAAMREFKAQWGDHTLDIIVHLPLSTPYTCLADGLTVATGNSIGRLDIRLAEELTSQTIHVSIRSKTTGRMIEFWPKPEYLRKIESRPVDQLESLARECITTDEGELYEVRGKKG